MFSSELCEISKNTFSYRTPLAATSCKFKVMPKKNMVIYEKSDRKV